MIAHHPRIAWMRSERFERVTIDARIRLAAAELAFDHHDVEEAREVPAHDLLALHAGITVGDEPERDTSRPQALERGEGVGEERPRGTSAVGEVGRHPRGQAVAEDRKSTRLNSSHVRISYAVFCLKKKKTVSEMLQR